MPLTDFSPHNGFERSPQSRGDRSEAVAIVDCWLWLIMAENLFSKTIIRLRHRFAIANSSRTQTSRPRRHRLTNPSTNTKKTAWKSGLNFVGVRIGYFADRGLLRLTPFRSARRGGPYKTSLRNELLHNFFCFHTLMPTNKFVSKHIKTKRCRLLDISLLRLFCGSWRIRTADPLLVRQML